jgi:hypothetical protein
VAIIGSSNRLYTPVQRRRDFTELITQLLQYSTDVSFLPGRDVLACESRRGFVVTVLEELLFLNETCEMGVEWACRMGGSCPAMS